MFVNMLEAQMEHSRIPFLILLGAALPTLQHLESLGVQMDCCDSINHLSGTPNRKHRRHLHLC